MLNSLSRSGSPVTPAMGPTLSESAHSTTNDSTAASLWTDGFAADSNLVSSDRNAPLSPLVRPAADFGTRARQRSGRISTLSASQERALIALSDPATVTSPEDFASRIEKIDDIFAANGDPRGAFTALYRVITNHAIASVRNEKYDDNAWASELVTDFGDLYLKNLHGHLTGGRVSNGWKRYYQLADNPNVSLERLASMGATVHLVIDLPDSLARIGTAPERRDDFMLFGDILLEKYPDMLQSALEGYNNDMSAIFGLFFMGDIVDAFHGEGTATRFGFQTIRNKAWIFGQRLQTIRNLEARAEILISWRTIDGILANLDAINVL